MPLSRRHFVQLGSLSLLAGTVLPAAYTQEKSDDETFSPEKLAALNGLSRQAFEPYVMERFAISLDGKSLGELTLIEISELTASASGVKPPKTKVVAQALTGFKLRFQGSDGVLPQGTYTFSQPALGKFPLFLVPAGPGIDPQTYTAIINKLATPGA
jgi:hypothetical protein